MTAEVSIRSFEKLDKSDLQRLADLALADLKEFFVRNPDTARLYKDRLIGLALCQGAAEHYVRPGRGIKDLDVWAFFSCNPERPFPYRRRGCVDFGPSKFGRHPDDKDYSGRRVDVIGRDIHFTEGSTPGDAIRRYLMTGRTASAGHLRTRPVVMLYPPNEFGKVVWEP
jgi:hypothetical protein